MKEPPGSLGVREAVHVDYTVLVMAGFAAGLVASLLGIAGGTILAPLLLAAGFETRFALAAGFAAAVAGGTAGSLHLYTRGVLSERSARLALYAALGSLAGALLSLRLPPRMIYALVAFSLAASTLMLVQRDPPRLPPSLVRLALIAAGVVAGATGKGGGSLYIPIYAALEEDSRRAAASARLTAALAALTGLLAYAPLLVQQLYSLLLIAAAAYAGGSIGSRLLPRMQPDVHRLLAALGYTLLAVALLVRAAV